MLKRFLIKSELCHDGEITCLVILGLMLTLVLVACSGWKNDPKADRSFITDMPCAAPCWYSLIPGEATKENVLETLEGLPFIDQASVKEYGTVWNHDNSAESIRFGCSHPRKEGCGAALVSNNQLEELWLTVNFPLDIETVVNKLGPPSFIDYGIYAPEVGGCFLSLVWSDKGIGVDYVDTKSDWLCETIQAKRGIPRNIEIEAIIYAVEDDFAKPGGCCQRIEWPGFENP